MKRQRAEGKNPYNPNPVYMEKQKARVKTRRAVKRGLIETKDYCEHCGTKERIEMHHPDYNKPFEVVFLCKQCHENEHVRMRKAQKTS